MMLFRQQALVLFTLALLALFASHQENGMMVAAQDDKEDKEDKDEIDEPVELDVGTETMDEIEEEMELPMSDDGNFTDMSASLDSVEDIDCSCDGGNITCSEPADEEACSCEDGDVVCDDVEASEASASASADTISEAPVETPVETMAEPPVSVDIDEPLPPDTEAVSGANSSPTMVSIAISAAGVAAIAALN
mmetsp:Transcript_14314/g.33328  ORF Transcript_14314/g.33328 Transcript_14314/m.33328 type:complete len:193 (+) Transcript_14314:76-654(+)|eukprot:CAMPEP_0197179322 /NCGR_PEP_ID=MMETSP1423-20130617/4316_1 /TAXON_ID=476441 /ORGANISM="Pseudo-nitzschia heimii, Strain UNC1101" /LENGTH=192 /DNA_ID=CAMNT_0042629219 /DNA_START=173 /DNA_END=751 /DNA_ORIENTATION=+